MEHAVRAQSTTHIWIVGALAALWNTFGAFDYVMTQTENPTYFAQFSAEEIAFFQSFPAWMEAFWAIGVWGGLAGSLLLLMRSRHAAGAFTASLAGKVVGLGYQLTAGNVPASLQTGAAGVMPYVITAAGFALLLYAMNMRRAGVLR